MAQGKSGVGAVRAETGELVFESREQGTNLSTSITVTRGIASTMRKHYDGFCGQCLAQDISFSNIPIDSLCIRVAIEGINLISSFCATQVEEMVKSIGKSWGITQRELS